MENLLEKEIKFYISHQDELVAKYNGKYLIIKDEEVKEAYNSQPEAYINAKNKFEAGTFIIQLCAPGKENYSQTFHSRVIFNAR